jgi:hypothetical protein
VFCGKKRLRLKFNNLSYVAVVIDAHRMHHGEKSEIDLLLSWGRDSLPEAEHFEAILLLGRASEKRGVGYVRRVPDEKRSSVALSLWLVFELIHTLNVCIQIILIEL